MFKIEFNKKDLRRIQSALKKVRTRGEFWFIKNNGDMPRLGALKYSNRVVEAITSQKYAGSYPGLSKRYEEYKEKHYPNARTFWELTGSLLRELRFFKFQEGWMGGIQQGSKSTPPKYGKSKDIAIYANANEQMRPLFDVTMEHFKGEWKRLGQDVLKDIRKAWK